MIYLWVKALHVAAVLTWVGGLLMLGVAVRASLPAGTVLLPHERRLGQAVLNWDRRVTVPAMLAVWALGITLTILGGWMGVLWLMAKLGIVFLLSGLHGIMSGTLRRRMGASPDASNSALMHYSPAITIVGAAGVALLVILKPW